jgi:hypothetical protein
MVLATVQLSPNGASSSAQCMMPMGDDDAASKDT